MPWSVLQPIGLGFQFFTRDGSLHASMTGKIAMGTNFTGHALAADGKPELRGNGGRDRD